MARKFKPLVFRKGQPLKHPLGPPVQMKDRINFKCGPRWYLKIAEHACDMGMSLSDFIRLSCDEQVRRDRCTRKRPGARQ